MNRKTISRVILFSMAVPMSLLASAATEGLSQKTAVFVNPDTSSFWRTAPGAAFTVPVRYPSGATTATLTVTGDGYSETYENVPEGDWSVTLPPAADPQAENVYDLTLDFGSGFEPQTARLGLIDGLKAGAGGATRCIFPSDTRKWSHVTGRSVVPVPYGTSVVTVDGTPVGTGLGGAQGWLVLGPLEIGAQRKLTASGEAFGETFDYEAEQVGFGGGMMMLLR